MIAALLLTMIVQCFVFVYWQGQRNNYYIDEMYSFEYAKEYSKESSQYITDGDAWGYDAWMDAGSLQSEMKVTEEDSLRELPLSETAELLLTKRTYMGLLNLVVSPYDSFQDYAQAALKLNILFFVASEILLMLCVSTLTGGLYLSLLSVVMFGFSAIITGMCEYVRFYMLAIMLLLVVVFCHLKLWDNNRKALFFLWELAAFAAACWGLKHSELFLVICGSFFCFFFVALLCRKKFVNAIIYAVPLLLGMYLFVYRKTNLLQVVLHPSEFARPKSHGIEAVTYNLLTATPERAWSVLQAIKECLMDKWFGGGVIILGFTAVLILWILRIAANPAGREDRRSAPDTYIGFAVILGLTVLTGIVFNALTYLKADRYQVFGIVLLMILFWYGAGILYRALPDKRLLAALTVVVVAGAVLCQQAEKLPFLYIEEKAISDKVEQYAGSDHILLSACTEGSYDPNTERHAFYDCLIHTDPKSRIYVADPFADAAVMEKEELPDQFTVWCVNKAGVDRMRSALEGEEYKIRHLGATHCNDIYLCEREP